MKLLRKTDWTEADLAELPQDGHRYEIIDGRLYVTPPAGEYHNGTGATLIYGLRHVGPEGWRVLYGIGLAIGEDTIDVYSLSIPGKYGLDGVVRPGESFDIFKPFPMKLTASPRQA